MPINHTLHEIRGIQKAKILEASWSVQIRDFVLKYWSKLTSYWFENSLIYGHATWLQLVKDGFIWMCLPVIHASWLNLALVEIFHIHFYNYNVLNCMYWAVIEGSVPRFHLTSNICYLAPCYASLKNVYWIIYVKINVRVTARLCNPRFESSCKSSSFRQILAQI